MQHTYTGPVFDRSSELREAMMNSDAFFIPDPERHGEKVPLLKSVLAIQLEQNPDGRAKLGLLSRLGPGIVVERCGKGFDDRTVKIRANGHYYFVFLQELESQATLAQLPQF
jgi:hypothetical protein